MGSTARTVHFVVVAATGLLGVASLSSAAVAQRAHPRVGYAAQPVPEVTDPRRITRPLSIATVVIETRDVSDGRRMPSRLHSNQRLAPNTVYFVPVPIGYAAYGPSRGGGVYDTDGRPLYEAYEMQLARQSQIPASTPDLSGTPYVVAEGGAMIVDFGDGRPRSVASCAALAADAAPDGRPRTIFYQGSGDGIILRAGSTGRVRGTPVGDAKVCYGVDAYGRTELKY